MTDLISREKAIHELRNDLYKYEEQLKIDGKWRVMEG